MVFFVAMGKLLVILACYLTAFFLLSTRTGYFCLLFHCIIFRSPIFLPEIRPLGVAIVNRTTTQCRTVFLSTNETPDRTPDKLLSLLGMYLGGQRPITKQGNFVKKLWLLRK